MPVDPAARETLVRRLLPHAALITPNVREAEALSGLTIQEPDDLAAAARQLLELGPGAVLVKGGKVEEEAPVVVAAPAPEKKPEKKSEKTDKR